MAAAGEQLLHLSLLGMLCCSTHILNFKSPKDWGRCQGVGLTRLVIDACRDAVRAWGLLAHARLGFRALLLVLVHLFQLLLSVEDLEPHHA